MPPETKIQLIASTLGIPVSRCLLHMTHRAVEGYLKEEERHDALRAGALGYVDKLTNVFWSDHC